MEEKKKMATRINIMNLAPEKINPTTLALLATTKPLVRLKGKTGLYRMWFRDLNGPNCIAVSSEEKKDHNGSYRDATFYRPEELEVVEIVNAS